MSNASSAKSTGWPVKPLAGEYYQFVPCSYFPIAIYVLNTVVELNRQIVNSLVSLFVGWNDTSIVVLFQ